MILRRTSFTPGGIFSHWFDALGNIVCVTGEHSYNLLPKLADGIYTCKQGMFQLDHEREAGIPASLRWQILGVPPFQGQPVTDILVHMGNLPQIDSKGCVLTGTEIEGATVVNSGVAYRKLINLLIGRDTFQLTVKS